MFSVIMVMMILGFILAGVALMLSAWREKGARRILRVVSAVFFVYGAVAFLSQSLCATGGLFFLPDKFEWPMGMASGVVRDSRGRYIVPHTPTGRVQVYDPDKTYIRGWMVEDGGGAFKLDVTEDDLIEVFTSRGKSHDVYASDGVLVREGDYEPLSYYELGREEYSREYFPTHIILYPFSSPFTACLFIFLALTGLFILDKTKSKGKGGEMEENVGE